MIPTSQYLMLAKIESTPGTDPTPDGSNDALLCENVRPRFPADLIERVGSVGTLSRVAPVLARTRGEIAFDVELAGSGAAGTPPDWGPLIRACGFEQTVASGVSVTYTPRSSGFETVTLYLYRTGLLYKLTYCQGTVQLTAAAGGRPMLSFNMMGIPDVAAGTIPTGPTLQGTVPPVVKSAAFALGGYAATIASIGIDMQCDVQFVDDVNGASGFGGTSYVGRNPIATIDPLAVAPGTHNFWSKWQTGASEALTITLGATAGNIFDIDAPACVRRELNEQERNGALAYTIPIALSRSSGDDEIAIVCT